MADKVDAEGKPRVAVVPVPRPEVAADKEVAADREVAADKAAAAVDRARKAGAEVVPDRKEVAAKVEALRVLAAGEDAWVARSLTAAAPCPWRVLIVDDDADVARSLAMILANDGHEVRVALDGASALRIAQSFEPELVTLDIAMPRMDGYQVCRLLRATPNGQRMVIVAATGLGEKREKRRARIAGFDSHLVKPVDAADVERFLARLAPRPRPSQP